MPYRIAVSGYRVTHPACKFVVANRADFVISVTTRLPDPHQNLFESRAMTADQPIIPDQSLDCENLLCPLPVLKARKRLLQMAMGEVLCLRATDPMAEIDLPHFCAEAGHSVISTQHDGRVQIYYIRRGPDRSLDFAKVQ